MTCNEVQALLAEGSGLPEGAAAHLAVCQECGAAAQRWAALRREFAALAAEPEPPFLHQRIMAAVRQAAAQSQPWWRRVPRAAWASAGVAAVLGVGVLATQGVLRLGGVERAAREEVAPQTVAPRGPELVAEHFASPAVDVPAKAVAQPAPKASPASPSPAAGRQRAVLRRHDEALGQALASPTARLAPAAAAPPPAAAADEREKRQVAEAEVRGLAARAETDAVRLAAAEHGVGVDFEMRAPNVSGAAPALVNVKVVLLAASGEEAFPLLLPEAMAPPPTQVWVVVIGEGGLVALEGPSPQAPDELRPVWERALADAHLSPGRYRAVRLRR